MVHMLLYACILFPDHSHSFVLLHGRYPTMAERMRAADKLVHTFPVLEETIKPKTGGKKVSIMVVHGALGNCATNVLLNLLFGLQGRAVQTMWVTELTRSFHRWRRTDGKTSPLLAEMREQYGIVTGKEAVHNDNKDRTFNPNHKAERRCQVCARHPTISCISHRGILFINCCLSFHLIYRRLFTPFWHQEMLAERPH